MSEDHDHEHVTRHELGLVLERIDQQFKAQFNKILLVMGVAVGFIKVDSLKSAGSLAVALAIAKIGSLLFFKA